MGIEVTQTISRKDAIERINFIAQLVKEENYLEIEKNTSEEFSPLNIEIFFVTDKYTNGMLETIMDKSFYRYSMFENYFIEDTNK